MLRRRQPAIGLIPQTDLGEPNWGTLEYSTAGREINKYQKSEHLKIITIEFTSIDSNPKGRVFGNKMDPKR